MIVKDIMTTDVYTLPPSATVWDAANLIDLRDIRHIPIVENDTLCGLVSERDILRNSFPIKEARRHKKSAFDCFDRPLREIMQDEVFTLSPTVAIKKALALFIDGRFGAVPIVDSDTGKLLGLVSYIDILQSVHDCLSLEE